MNAQSPHVPSSKLVKDRTLELGEDKGHTYALDEGLDADWVVKVEEEYVLELTRVGVDDVALEEEYVENAEVLVNELEVLLVRSIELSSVVVLETPIELLLKIVLAVDEVEDCEGVTTDEIVDAEKDLVNELVTELGADELDDTEDAGAELVVRLELATLLVRLEVELLTDVAADTEVESIKDEEVYETLVDSAGRDELSVDTVENALVKPEEIELDVPKVTTELSGRNTDEAEADEASVVTAALDWVDSSLV